MLRDAQNAAGYRGSGRQGFFGYPFMLKTCWAQGAWSPPLAWAVLF